LKAQRKQQRLPVSKSRLLVFYNKNFEHFYVQTYVDVVCTVFCGKLYD